MGSAAQPCFCGLDELGVYGMQGSHRPMCRHCKGCDERTHDVNVLVSTALVSTAVY